MPIDDRVIGDLQSLGALRLDPQERRTLMANLERVLGYVDQLRAVDTEGVEPTSSVIEVGNVLREDEPHACLPVEQALAQAPARRGDHFEVPVVLGEE